MVGLSGILVAAMHERIPSLSMAIVLAVTAILSACATGQAPVVEKLDELTAVTITHNRTPIILSPDTPLDPAAARDYVQIGVIEINRMGSLRYYLWLGISEMQPREGAAEHPVGYESIVLAASGGEFPLDAHGWTHETIGSSEPVYKRLFWTSADAYYEVTLEQIQLLNDVGAIQLHTTGPAAKTFVPSYGQSKAKHDLAEFLRTVSQ
jgi:hypothetical protein